MLNLDAIPQELKLLRQWVLWVKERRDGKLTKVLKNARTGKNAESDDPSTWSTFDEAVDGLEVFAEFDGVGFVFSADDPYVGIDLDSCVGENLELADWARQIVDTVDTYTEYSPSQKGVHMIARAVLPPGRRRKGPLEMYSEGRYFTMTGDHLWDTPIGIEERCATIAALHRWAFPEEHSPTNGAAPMTPVSIDDQELMEKALRANPRMEQLWRGDRKGYDSGSEADLALCSHLAWWTGNDAGRIERLFEQSGLVREKWQKRADYRTATIAKAINGTTSTYQPTKNGGTAEANGAGAVAHDWEDPIPLDSVPLPEFPVDVFPDYLREMIEGTACATQTPPDLAAMVSLSVLATAAQKRAEALIRDGWREVLSLWTVTSLPPGNRKTPAFEPMVKPVREYEQLVIERMRTEIAEATTEYEITEGALKRLKDQAMKAKNQFDRDDLTRQAVEMAHRLERMPVPKSLRMIADDATPEELGRLLMGQGGRIAIISDEGDVFDMMAGKYSSGKPNIGIYLRAHAGGDIIVDRVGRPDVIVRRAAISFGLCVQPESLQGLTANRVFKGRGLLGRFLFSLPYSRLGAREIRPAALSEDVAADYSNRITVLLSMPADEPEPGCPQPHLIPFTREADDAVAEFEAWIEPRLKPSEELGDMSDWAGKLAGHTCRIATLLHLAQRAYSQEPWRFPVEASTFAGARRIGEYLIPHARMAFRQMGSNPQIENARHVLRWLKKHDRSRFQKREVFNGLRSRFERSGDLDEPLIILEEHGYIRQVHQQKRPGPGQPASPTFDVHPSVSAYSA